MLLTSRPVPRFSLLVFLLCLPYAVFAGKELSIIQKPLINVPAIALPGDSIILEYDLPDQESLVYVNLFYKNREIEVSFRHLDTPGELGYRRVLVYLPEKMMYGIYDLQVYGSAPASIDVSENALYIIPDYKEKYTFVHITDTHLPSHQYWGDAGVESDSTELEDFRAVIRDINLINPEFVLHTGDLINDGELEALGIPAISRSREILEELEVPVFIVPGNHDLGGWDETPAPDGTARRSWWQYFGWPALDNTASGAVNTQNYVFEYGTDIYIGMESYINYDRWRENIYGYQGFTDTQLQWLNGTLERYRDRSLKVMFYHYDFENQLNLESLGVDAAFWGHIHYNSGSTSAYPLDLSTGSVCDGRRWYRIVKVENHQITQTWSIQTGDNGEVLTQTYHTDSTGITLTNNSVMDFEHCLVKFPLKEGQRLLSLENAVLYQIDSLSSPATVYALAALQSNSTLNITMETENIQTGRAEINIPGQAELFVYPNPFNPKLSFSLDLPEHANVYTEILDLHGRRIQDFPQQELSAGRHDFSWDAAAFSAGIYLVRSRIADRERERSIMKKCVLLK